jgi:hypothetical protein
MKITIDNGMLTFGSPYVGLSVQLYWPMINLEWEPKSVSDRGRAYPHGFCARFATVVRVKVGKIDKHLAFAFRILGFGAGIQHIGRMFK